MFLNRGFTTALATIGIAQFLKLPIKKFRTGKWDVTNLLGTGGMPSSHSAAVTSLTTYIAMDKGVKSIDFALSTMFGLIVMYDAMGIRRHAGEIAMQVNKLDVEVEKLAGHHPGIYHQRRHKELKEMLGHQPEEVFGGAVLGTIIGTLSYLVQKK
jgi:hypothetical protein